MLQNTGDFLKKYLFNLRLTHTIYHLSLPQWTNSDQYCWLFLRQPAKPMVRPRILVRVRYSLIYRNTVCQSINCRGVLDRGVCRATQVPHEQTMSIVHYARARRRSCKCLRFNSSARPAGRLRLTRTSSRPCSGVLVLDLQRRGDNAI